MRTRPREIQMAEAGGGCPGAAVFGDGQGGEGTPAVTRPSSDVGTGLKPRVTVYSKPGCHLCVEAESVVGLVCAELNLSWESIDISADAELLARYGEQIPVTFVDGRQHDYWRVSADRLRVALG